VAEQASKIGVAATANSTTCVCTCRKTCVLSTIANVAIDLNTVSSYTIAIGRKSTAIPGTTVTDAAGVSKAYE